MKKTLAFLLLALAGTISALAQSDLQQRFQPRRLTAGPTALMRSISMNLSEDGLGTYGASGGGVVSSIGAPTIPVIMADFADRAFQDSINEQKISRYFNEKGYADEHYARGSVRDYFLAQSNGLFSPTFEVVAHVRLSKGYAYYGQDSSTGAIDVNCNAFVQETLDSAVARGVDFSKYCVGEAVPNVCIIHAGPGEHSSYEEGYTDYLWAHFNKHRFTAGDTEVQSYFVGNELRNDYTKDDGTVEYSDDAHEYPIVQSAMMAGIGVIVHELGHALGLPDYYCTSSDTEVYNKCVTMHYWSVMDYGQYFYDSYGPVGYTAYERNALGWLKIRELTDASIAQIYAFDDTRCPADGDQALLIRNSENLKEYYILENRQAATWYPKMMGTGLFITHVDYDENAWIGNTVNNDPLHQRFSYVAADNSKPMSKVTAAELKGDLFPGTTNSTEFSDTTSPASRVFTTSEYLSKPIYGIEVQDGIVSICYLDKSLTSIATALADDGGKVCVYTIGGQFVGTYAAGEELSLPAGLYVVKGKNKSQTVFVR